MRWFSASRIVALAVATAAVLFLAGWLTREDPAEKPYLRIAGSGFLFNYRIAEVSYGFSVEVLKPLPTGTIIEAAFEDPSGGADLVVRRRVSPETARYGFQSPAVRNVEARRPYRIEIVVFDREEKTEIWRHRFTVASQIGDEVMPERALTIGPGYTPNLQR
jgi:hypothetical protein